MKWILLIFAFSISNVGDQDAPSMFDQPTNWARVIVVCVLVAGAVALHIADRWRE